MEFSVRANARNDLYETVTIDEEPTAYIRRLNEKAVAEELLPESYEKKTPTKQKEIKVSKTDPAGGRLRGQWTISGFRL